MLALGRPAGNLIVSTHVERRGTIEAERKDSRRLSEALRLLSSRGLVSPVFSVAINSRCATYAISALLIDASSQSTFNYYSMNPSSVKRF